jgi:hypothetical protein
VRVLFDQGTPAPLRTHLAPHEVVTAFELNWGALENGALLAQAESRGFDVLVTTDQNLLHQQNLRLRTVAIVVLTTTSWPRIRAAVPAIADAISAAVAGSYVEVNVP